MGEARNEIIKLKKMNEKQQLELQLLQAKLSGQIRQLGIRASNFYAEVSASDADQPTLKSFVQTSQPTHKSSKTNQPVSCPAARDKESHSWSCQACNYLHENREIDLMHCAVCGLIRNDQQQVSSLLAVVHKPQGLSQGSDSIQRPKKQARLDSCWSSPCG